MRISAVRLFAALHALGVAQAAKPNFLFFITDDQAALPDLDGDLAAVMPATRSLIFDAGLNLTASAYTSSPICCPSRTALFSSRYTHNLGDPSLGWCGNFSHPAVREDTILNALALQGYAVGQFGKWYNEEGTFAPPYVPDWKKADAANASMFYAMLGEVRYFNLTYNRDGQLVTDFNNGNPSSYSTSVIGNATVDWLKTAAPAAAAGERHFVGYVAVHAPHLPATPAPWYADAPLPGTGRAPRTPNYNAGWEDKHWYIDNGLDKPMSAALANATDVLWGQRLRTLMSVDDVVRACFDVLQDAGALDNTYVIFTSDHGYHLGQWGVWAEKANPLENDARVPLAIRGPGIKPGTSTPPGALVTNIDLPATMLELAGAPNAWPSGMQQRDGRSIVPLLFNGGAIPASGWRDRLLIEFVGWQNTQWLAPCTFALTSEPCPPASGPAPVAGMTNAASNNYVALRVRNATHDYLYGEWRPAVPTPLSPAQTNWTEAYDVAADEWQITNLAVKNRMPAAQLAQWSSELWSVAHCVGAACP